MIRPAKMKREMISIYWKMERMWRLQEDFYIIIRNQRYIDRLLEIMSALLQKMSLDLPQEMNV